MIKRMKRLISSLLVLSLFVAFCCVPAFAAVDGQGDWGDQGDGTFVNPILNADYSDPDVIRVGDKYYMIASTFQLAPGMVILESTDLVNWKTINYCIPDMSQFGDKYSWKEMNGVYGGVYAGSLRYLEWKEKQEDGTYKDCSKWFMYTTLFQGGIVVATADDVYGEWTAQYMKDKNGKDLDVTQWDDNCPYWEFNEDGTLKAAYMTASKCNGAWYLHVFEMSLDGMQLKDADRDCMAESGDFTRVRNESGQIVDSQGNVIQTNNAYLGNYDHAMNDDGSLPSVLDAVQITGNEGTVVRDIYTTEASKVITFGADTEIGQSTFTGRHGENQKVCEYVYIFTSEDWDGIRFGIISRAKSIYGDHFDDEGTYTGPGTPDNPGSYETQRLILSTTNPDTRNPNQGAFIDVPASMSTDGEEHWYWITQFGRSDYTNMAGERVEAPDCRATSLQPVTWVEGFPLVGNVTGELSKGEADPDATMYDGTGLEGNTVTDKHHPDAKYVPGTFVWEMEKPPIEGNHEIVDYQGSDNFEYTQYNTVNKLNPMWQWWYQPRDDFWDLTGSALRLYAFKTQDGTDNPMRAGNTVCQRYISADYVQVDVTMDLSGMQNGQVVGLLHTTGATKGSSIKLKMENGQKSIEGYEVPTNEIILRSTVGYDKVNHYSYSVDGGNTFTDIGSEYKLTLEAYRGDYISIFCYNNNETNANAPENGYVDVEDFRYTYSRQGDDLNITAFASDCGVERGADVQLTAAATDNTALWFAPLGTTVFEEGAAMTKAVAGEMKIQAPSTPGEYYLYAVQADGTVSQPSRACLTVYCQFTEQRIEMEDYVWGVTHESISGYFWVNTVETASNGKILDNTLAGDVFYLGKVDLTDVSKIALSMAHANGGVTARIYADMSVDQSAMTLAEQITDKHDAENRYFGTDAVSGGTLIAEIDLDSTSGWATYQTVSAPVSQNLTGEHDVYVKLDGETYGGNHDYISFIKINQCSLTKTSNVIAEAATCRTAASYYLQCEDCGAVSNTETVVNGEKDSSNHTGGTEIRDAKDPTTTEEGYTGDTWCLGCETKIENGEVIPVLENPTTSGYNGDVDADGEIDVQDAAMVYAIANGKTDATEAQLAVADVDGDGEVTPMDAAMIYAYANGKITQFPASANN